MLIMSIITTALWMGIGVSLRAMYMYCVDLPRNFCTYFASAANSVPARKIVAGVVKMLVRTVGQLKTLWKLHAPVGKTAVVHRTLF